MANAVLDVVENEKLPERAMVIGEMMLNELAKLKEKYSLIGDVRGMGMFIGIDLVVDRITKEPATMFAEYIVAKFKEAKILMSTEGKYGNILKFKPPMVFDEANVAHFISTFDDILSLCDSFPRTKDSASSRSSLCSSDSVGFECFSSDSLESDEDSLISE